MNSLDKGYCWPTPEQEFLLKAALLDGDIAVRAWKDWAAAVNFDLLDAGSQRLLPLLYWNLTRQNVQHHVLEVYKGFYRMAWYKNQLLLHRLNNVLRLFTCRKIPAVLLKGTAMAHLYYKNWALRPMNDFDLLVPQKKVLLAVDLLCENGWSPRLCMPNEADLKIRHAVTLVDGSGIDFDLHWRVILEWGMNNFERKMKSEYIEIYLDGRKAYTLSPTDQLFHILIHGARWNAVAPLRWIPDALVMLRQAGTTIDWNKLLREVRERNLIVPFQESIIYLRKVFDAPVPDDVMQAVTKLRPSAAERLEFWMHSHPRGFVRDFLYLWFMHIRSSASKSFGRLLVGFPSFLRQFWKVPENRNLVFFLVGKGIGKIIRKKKNNAVHEAF